MANFSLLTFAEKSMTVIPFSKLHGIKHEMFSKCLYRPHVVWKPGGGRVKGGVNQRRSISGMTANKCLSPSYYSYCTQIIPGLPATGRIVRYFADDKT